MNTTLKKLLEMLQWAKEHKLYAHIKFGYYADGKTQEVYFDCQAESYKMVHLFAKEFKVKFHRIQSATEGALDYEAKKDNINISLYAISELPPFCRVIYEDIKVLAQEAYTKTIARVVCH